MSTKDTCCQCKFYGESGHDFSFCAANPPVIVEAMVLSWMHENKAKAGNDYDPDDPITVASRHPYVGPNDRACRLFEETPDVSRMFGKIGGTP